ncbi:fimbrial protein [Erwinia rhapontici]|uniref:fimbrial protein n=1 Tax=Erwinia rhapontici TaxID=55212 RepID=UPI003B9DEFE5
MISSKRLWSKAWAAGLGVAWLLINPQVSSAYQLSLSVDVIPSPSCEINGKRPIEVDFGEVLTYKVNGDNYKKNVLFDIKCTNTTANDMSISIKGTKARFGKDILGTDKEILGIEFLSNGQPVTLNSEIKFTYPNLPKLQAVPVKSPGMTLQAGKFSAAATMTVTYH